MKHIKHINELLRSTLLSASDKSRSYGQKVKSQRFIKHAVESGENVPVDRIFPHAFIFDYITDERFSNYVHPYIPGAEPPYFYITDWKIKLDGFSIEKRYVVVFLVTLKSNYGKSIKLECNINEDGKFRCWLETSSDSIYFKFSSEKRKDAVQFKKFLLEDLTPEFLEDIEDFRCSDATCDYVLDNFDNEDDKFFYVDGDGIPSIYIGFFKDIKINDMINDY
jgi:hypothetical protein